VEFAVKYSLSFVALFFSTSAALATEITVFGQRLQLTEGCSLEVRHPDGNSEVRALPFAAGGNCAFFPHHLTDVPRLEFLQGAYVLLIESQRLYGDGCRGELAGVVIAKDGGVKVSTRTQATSVCGYGEQKDFEILQYHAE